MTHQELEIQSSDPAWDYYILWHSLHHIKAKIDEALKQMNGVEYAFSQLDRDIKTYLQPACDKLLEIVDQLPDEDDDDIEFFLKDGLPEVQIRKGRKSGKPTKRYISLRKFQKCLGLAPSLESSGDKHQSKVNSGSKLCRKAFWQWVFSRLEVKRCRLDNEVHKVLCEFLDTEKAMGKPIRLVRSRVASKAVKLLFRELVKQRSALEVEQ